MSVDPRYMVIRVALQGAREAAAEVQGLRTTINATNADIKRGGLAASMAGRNYQSLTQQTQQLGSTMTRRLTLPILGVAAASGKLALEFDRTMAQAGRALDLTGDEMEQLRALAIKTGQDTIYSANESGEAILELAKGGMKAAQIEAGALEATVKLAAAGGIGLAQAGNQVTRSMNTFSLAAEDAVTIADALAGGANASSAELTDLSAALQQVGQQAVASGLSMQETVGTLAAFSDQGIIGSDAGTSLKTFLQRLTPQSDKAKAMIKELGIEFFDAEGNMKGITKIAGELQGAFKGMTQEQRLSTMQTLFGSDATRAANIIYNQGAEGLEKYIMATKEKGAADKMAEAQMSGLAGAWEQLKGSFETAALTLGTALTPTLMVLAAVVKVLVDGFTALPAPVQSVIATLLVMAAVAGPLIWLIGAVAGSSIVASLAFAASAIAAGEFALAMQALNLAFLTNPVFLVVAAVVALVAAVVIAYHKVGWFRDFVDGAFDWVVQAGKNVGTAVVGAFRWILQAAKDTWGWIKNAAGNVGDFVSRVWKVISRVAKIAFQAIRLYFTPLEFAIRGGFALFRAWAKLSWKVISTGAKIAWTIIKTAALIVFKVVKKHFEIFILTPLKFGFNVIKKVGGAVWGFIKDKAGPVFNWIKNAASDVGGWFKDAAHTIASTFTGVFNSIKGPIVDVLNFVIDRINDLINAHNKLPFVGDIGNIGSIEDSVSEPSRKAITAPSKSSLKSSGLQAAFRAQRRAQGGPIGLGRWGGGDRIPVLGEAGEFMFRKETARDIGYGTLARWNRDPKQAKQDMQGKVTFNDPQGGKKVIEVHVHQHLSGREIGREIVRVSEEDGARL